MVCGEDVLLNLFVSSGFRLKPDQEVAVRALVEGKDVLAVLPTGYIEVMARASSIKCSFVPEDYELDGQAAILVIFQLINIVEDQIREVKSLGCSVILIATTVLNAGSAKCLISCSFPILQCQISGSILPCLHQ